MCSYSIHFADTKAAEQAARARQIQFIQGVRDCRFPGDPRTARPRYPLLHQDGRVAAQLKKVEAPGFDEVILYFNVDLKPHSQVKDEMARFTTEVAPAFD
jgi:hypothetical protein